MKEPVKRIAFILHGENLDHADLIIALEQHFATVEYMGSAFDFEQTKYYEKEMGRGLQRSVWSFEGLIDASEAVNDKLLAVQIENDLRNSSAGRKFNVDVGYLDSDKVILTSFKKGPYKIYAHSGVWLDLAMNYSKGVFTGTSYTFSDFKINPYQKDLMRIREFFKRDLKKLRS